MNTNRRWMSLIILCWLSFGAYAQEEYSAIYVFGDSLSDNGNFTHYYGEFIPPYDSNSVTNASFGDSKVAVEVLAESLGLPLEAAATGGTNYSFIGALASETGDGSLADQMTKFIAMHSVTGTPSIPSDALYVVFFGGNDVRAARDEPDFIKSRQIIRSAVKNIGESVRTLIGLGAQHIMVVNTPDIGKIPETDFLAQAVQVPWLPTIATWKSRQFNARLFFEMWKVQAQTGKKVTQFNLFRTLNSILFNSEELGLVNNSDACFNYFTTGLFHPDCNSGFNAHLFVFFDEIHPSTTVHNMIGQALSTRLSTSAVSTALAN